jgi:prophage regulatory protein
MKRLPRKTKGPIRVHASGRGIIDRDARLLPQVGGTPAQSDESQRTDHAPSLKLLRFPAVRERTGLSRTTIWRLERHGDFPRHRRISANTVAWVEDEVMGWIRSKVDGVAV